MIHCTNRTVGTTVSTMMMQTTSTSLKRRNMKRRNHTNSWTWIALTQALLLLSVTVWADDSATPQQSPPSEPIFVTPTPVSRPSTTAPVRPTSKPIVAPTRRPTGRPVTSNPTEPPTSEAPTAEPTIPPSPKPAVIESASPSVKPSLAPSRRPSEMPSVSPKPTSVTMSPTLSPPPTVSPTFTPITRAPQSKPVQKPISVISPTYTPTLTPQNTLVSVDVILSGMEGKLDTIAQDEFKTVTGDFIYYSLQELDISTDVKIVDVSIDITSQIIERQGRKLVSDLTKLRVRYNALIEYQSKSDNSDAVPEWVDEIFNTEYQRNLYLTQLRKSDSDAFDIADNVVVLVDGVEPPEVTPIDEKSENGFFSNENLWYIIGAVGGTISLVVIITTIYAIGRSKRRKSEIAGKPNMTTVTKIKNQFSYDSDLSPTNKLHYTAEIDVDLQNDDVSTLGDPTYYGGAPDQATVAGGPILVPFSTNGTTTTQKLYHPTDPRERFLSEDDTDDNIRYSESNLSKQNDDDIVVHTVIDDSADHGGNDDNNTGLADDELPESSNNVMMTKAGGVTGSKYAVEVPPGKLGMIIDTPDSGPPVVHTIKPESILCATVQAGDYLISVDDEGVTHMTAVQVSKLISIKSDQHRKLVFLRKPIQRNRINSSSSDYFVEQNGAC